VLVKGVIPAVAVPPHAREREFIAQMGRNSVISGMMHGRCKSRACGGGSTSSLSISQTIKIDKVRLGPPRLSFRRHRRESASLHAYSSHTHPGDSKVKQHLVTLLVMSNQSSHQSSAAPI
jgi:hypothetical protein